MSGRGYCADLGGMDQMSIVDMEPVNLDDGAEWTFERSVSAAPAAAEPDFSEDWQQ
jgi:hypothetical protein